MSTLRHPNADQGYVCRDPWIHRLIISPRCLRK